MTSCSRHVAEAMTKSAPDAACCCARIGGDEFAVLLEGAGAADRRRGRHARSSPASTTPIFVGGAQVQVSASIGLAQLARSLSEEDLLRQSDVALYAAKGAGRNGFAWFDRGARARAAPTG